MSFVRNQGIHLGGLIPLYLTRPQYSCGNLACFLYCCRILTFCSKPAHAISFIVSEPLVGMAVLRRLCRSEAIRGRSLSRNFSLFSYFPVSLSLLRLPRKVVQSLHRVSHCRLKGLYRYTYEATPATLCCPRTKINLKNLSGCLMRRGSDFLNGGNSFAWPTRPMSVGIWCAFISFS